MDSVKRTTEVIHHITAWGGRAKFVEGKLFDVVWSPYPGRDGLQLTSANIDKFSELMRFLRVVEKERLGLEYHAHILASNSGDGETQIWFAKPRDQNLEEVVTTGAHIYEDRFGIKPNVLILNDKDDSDVGFWEGKIRRVHWLLPTHFRLTYEPQDAETNE